MNGLMSVSTTSQASISLTGKAPTRVPPGALRLLSAEATCFDVLCLWVLSPHSTRTRVLARVYSVVRHMYVYVRLPQARLDNETHGISDTTIAPPCIVLRGSLS